MKRTFKKLLITLLLIFLAAAVAGGFLLTLGIRRYHSVVEEQLGKAVGKPVRLGDIGVSLVGGVTVSLKKLAVFPDERSQKPAISAEGLDVSLKLLPLLKKRVEIGTLRIVRPKLAFAKDSKGNVTIEGFPPPASRPSAPAATAAPPADLSNLPFSIGSLEIRQAEIGLSDPAARPPFSLTIGQLDVTILHLAFGQPIDFRAQAAFLGLRQNLFLRGRLRLPALGNPGSLEGLKLEAKGLDLELLYPAAGPGDTAVRGKLSFQLEGGAPSLLGQDLAKSLRGSGRLRAENLTLVNTNLLREVLSKITVIPGLIGILEARLPASYKEKLSRRDTTFEPIDIQADLKDGVLAIDDFRLATDTLELAGRGTIGLDGKLNSSMTLRLEPELSEAVVGSVGELLVLVEGGRFTLPVVISGTLPAVTVFPDLSYIASRVFTQKAGDVLGDLLDQVLKP